MPFKISFFFWRICKKRLPIGEVMKRLDNSEEVLRYWYDKGLQTWEYLFFKCPKDARFM